MISGLHSGRKELTPQNVEALRGLPRGYRPLTLATLSERTGPSFPSHYALPMALQLRAGLHAYLLSPRTFGQYKMDLMDFFFKEDTKLGGQGRKLDLGGVGGEGNIIKTCTKSSPHTEKRENIY